MHRLTPQERWIVFALVVLLILGTATQAWRARTVLEDKPAEIPANSQTSD